MFADFFEPWTHQKQIVLTPNQRQARYIHQQYDKYIASTGETSWPTLAIYPLNTWVKRLWEEKPNTLHRLTTLQLQLLWEKCIEDSNPELSSLHLLAIETWKLCHTYNISFQSKIFDYHEDSQLFQQWAKSIMDIYKKNHWIDDSLLVDHLIKGKLSPKPKEIILVNFVDFTPQEKVFLSWIENQGVTITQKQFACENNIILKTPAADSSKEFNQMVKWAIQHSKDKTVACVIPELSSKRDQIDYLFKSYLDDISLYTISLGKPLIEYPMIKQALNLLDMQEAINSPLEWTNLFQSHLQSNDWPRQTLDSETFQLLDAWHNLINQFLESSLITPHLTFREAKSRLATLAKNTIFQPKTSPNTKIHVLGILEASGLIFDSMWISSMHDGIWPSSANANPFIPRPLQRKHNLPHSSAQQEIEFCEQITHQLQKGADEIIFSYPLFEGENALRESPLISSFLEGLPLISERKSKAEKILGTSKLEEISDDLGPEVDVSRLKHRSSAVFKDQAACPFRAFARHRLGAKNSEMIEAGFNAMMRGQIMHAILEKIWKQIKTHEQLCALSEIERKELLHSNIDKILDNYKDQTSSFFISLEKERLQSLLYHWLNYEKERESFVVIATEEKYETTFKGMPLKLRIDRIDKLANDEYLIIDYKTSQCSKSQWFGERPDDPQLPLYYIVSALPVKNIAYAQIREKEMKLITMSDSNKYQEFWEGELEKLAEEYLKGNAKVQPKYGAATCRYCDLASLCRIRPGFDQ